MHYYSHQFTLTFNPRYQQTSDLPINVKKHQKSITNDSEHSNVKLYQSDFFITNIRITWFHPRFQTTRSNTYLLLF